MAKLMILMPDLRAGGFEKVRVLLADEFYRRGHDVSLVVMQRRGELISRVPDGIKIVDLNVARGRYTVHAFARLLRREKPDAVLAGMWPLTVFAALARVISGHDCRLVLSEHNQLSRQYKSWGKGHELALRLSLFVGHRLGDFSVAVSKGVADDIARLSGLSEGDFAVIYNPVEASVASNRILSVQAERLWVVPRGARILTVGSLKKQKNHELLLRAFAQMPNSASRLMVLGEGDLRSVLENLAKELHVWDRVFFAGFCATPFEFFETADLFVLSSDYEGMPNVLLEALAAGTPVVSTDCESGPAEILEGGRWGRLTPVGDVDALANAMAEALQATHDPWALKARAREFSVGKAVGRYLELLCPESEDGSRT